MTEAEGVAKDLAARMALAGFDVRECGDDRAGCDHLFVVVSLTGGREIMVFVREAPGGAATSALVFLMPGNLFRASWRRSSGDVPDLVGDLWRGLRACDQENADRGISPWTRGCATLPPAAVPAKPTHAEPVPVDKGTVFDLFEDLFDDPR